MFPHDPKIWKFSTQERKHFSFSNNFGKARLTALKMNPQPILTLLQLPVPNIETYQRILKNSQLWCPREDESFCKSQPNRHSSEKPEHSAQRWRPLGSAASSDCVSPQLWFSGWTQVLHVEPYYTILFLWLNSA